MADESARLNENAHRRLLAEGRPREAAMAAMGVAGAGWLGRATRLLADLPGDPMNLVYISRRRD